MVLAVLVGGIALLTALTLATADPTAAAPASAGSSDVALYAAVVDGLRAGGEYYAVTAEQLRAGAYPLKPFVTFRLPTLAMAQAALPPLAVAGLLYALAAGVLVAWQVRFRAALRRPFAIAFALLLLAGGSLAGWQRDLAGFHEVWAGLLLALSLARWRPERWTEAVGWGLAAALIRETATMYLLLMAAAAWRDGDRRQALGWLAAIGLVLLVLLAHALAVAQVVRPLDPASPGWTGLLGPGFAVRAVHAATALSLAPLALAAPLLGLAWFGWSAWRDPLAMRVAVVIGGYATLLAIAARADTFYWVLLIAPISLVGLAFAPDGLRDLAAGALDRRRIVVRRVAP